MKCNTLIFVIVLSIGITQCLTHSPQLQSNNNNNNNNNPINPSEEAVVRAVMNIKENSRAFQSKMAEFHEKTGNLGLLPKEYMVPMKDGVKLFTLVWDPRLTDKKVSTVIVRSPYGPWATENMADLFWSIGYVAVMQNERGTGKSEGNFDFWGQSADDFDATLEFLKTMPWWNGKVYQVGASADGILSTLDMKKPQPDLHGQWLLITTGHVYPVAFERSSTFRYALCHHWLDIMHSWRPKDPLNYVDYLLQHEGFNVTSQNPFFGWPNITLAGSDLQNVNFPAIWWAGYYDIFLGTMLESFRDYDTLSAPGGRGQQQIFIGPRGHCFAETTVSFPDDRMIAIWSYERSLDIFKHPDDPNPSHVDIHSGESWLQEEDIVSSTSQFKKYTLYVMGPNTKEREGMYWSTMDKLPTPTPKTLFFTAEGLLNDTTPYNSVAQTYTYDPKNPVPTVGGNNLFLECGPQDQRKVENRTDVMLFKTQPFTSVTPLCGNIKATLYVSSDRVDTDFMIKATDVYPTGESMLLGDMPIRMRWRNSRTAPELMENGKIYEIEIEMWMTTYIFNPGHVLQIAISSSNYPRYSANPNNGKMVIDGGELLVAKNTVYVGGATPSKITIPVVTMADLPKNVHDV